MITWGGEWNTDDYPITRAEPQSDTLSFTDFPYSYHSLLILTAFHNIIIYVSCKLQKVFVVRLIVNTDFKPPSFLLKGNQDYLAKVLTLCI